MYSFIVGIDVSKLTLDAVILTDGSVEKPTHYHVSNTPDEIQKLFKGFAKIPNFSLEKCLICIEATGVYTYPILSFVAQHQANIWVESGTRIKRSGGIQRGKTDKVDALRIATYASKNQENIRLWKPMNSTIDKIKNLTSLRDRLMKSKQKLTIPVEEFRQMGDTKTANLLSKAMQSSVEALEKDIIAIEKQIKKLLDQDEDLKELFALVTSVVGIGTQTAIALIVYTDGFTLFDDARKLACYAGVAPFSYTSGTSVRGRTGVSPMANMTLKSVLHMASLTAVKLDHQLKDYYERKVAQGKRKMSVLNAVKAKLLHRVMSVVQRKEKYENSVNFSLVLS
jgi:transposase